MKIAIGIDVGISTTKIVGIREGKVIKPLRIKATDPVTSLYGAFGKYLYDNKIDLSDVEQVMLTGVGAHYVNKPVYGLPTAKADEFLADGLGAQFESKLQRMIVVSMGTGTSLVLCDGNERRHLTHQSSDKRYINESTTRFAYECNSVFVCKCTSKC